MNHPYVLTVVLFLDSCAALLENTSHCCSCSVLPNYSSSCCGCCLTMSLFCFFFSLLASGSCLNLTLHQDVDLAIFLFSVYSCFKLCFHISGQAVNRWHPNDRRFSNSFNCGRKHRQHLTYWMSCVLALDRPNWFYTSRGWGSLFSIAKL